MSAPELAAVPPAARATLAAFSAGAISAEIALMRLLLALGDEAALFQCLGKLGVGELLALAERNRAGITRTAALVRAGLTQERSGSIAAIREQFDRAVCVAAEASVALYSLGSAETLDRATAEIVERLREWELLGPEIAALEIGCGIGRIERALAPHLRAITGIDVSPEMIAEARRRCGELANVEFAVCGGADLAEFSGRRYDLILAVDSFPYLVAADPAIAGRHIADAADLLNPGGVLGILNYSYRGDLSGDCAEVRHFAANNGLAVEHAGARDFVLWDGATFLLRKPGRVSAPRRRG
jgi:SAM-dependent methyltransferase